MSRQKNTPNQRITVLVADDHDLLRYGIRSMIDSADDIEVIGEASSGAEAIVLYQEKRPDVCILDITMPERNGIETTREILEYDPHARVLILTMHIGEEYLDEVINAGANGYMMKDSARNELLECIRAVHRGEKVFSQSVSKFMNSCYVRKVQSDKEQDKAAGAQLTRREREVLQLIAEGNTSSEISEKLFISPRTVDTHRANLMSKLDIRNTAGLVRYAIEKNIVAPSN